MTLALLQSQIEEFRRVAAGPDLQCDAPLSRWCVAEHIDHCIRVTHGSLAVLLKAKPQEQKLRLIGRVILAIGWIPRGRGRAPEKLRGAKVEAAEVEASLNELDRMVSALGPQSFADTKTRVLRHPWFGGLTAGQTLRFLVIHNRHHLKIIRDIVRKKLERSG